MAGAAGESGRDRGEPTGAKGAGGTAAAALGRGRKGRPFIGVPASETRLFADIERPGMIRHIWFALPDRTEGSPFGLRTANQPVEACDSTSSVNNSEGFFQLWILRARLLISEATMAR